MNTKELGIKVGDFFIEVWGYDQTNITFHKVVAVTAKGVKIQKWSNRRVGAGEGHYDSVVPGDKPAYGWENGERAEAPVKQKLVQSYGQGENQKVYLNMTSYSNANLWDGKAAYQTATGYGH